MSTGLASSMLYNGVTTVDGFTNALTSQKVQLKPHPPYTGGSSQRSFSATPVSMCALWVAISHPYIIVVFVIIIVRQQLVHYHLEELAHLELDHIMANSLLNHFLITSLLLINIVA